MRGAGAWARRAAAALFPALTLAAAVWLWPLLFKLGNRTLCLADWEGFCEEALRPLPGGCLHFAAEFLSALWAVPWLGWAVFVAAGLGMAAWAWRSGRTPRWWGLLPFAATLWAVAYCGVSVWVFVDPAFPWVWLLGWGVAAALSGGGWRAAVAAAALYPLCGTPALLGALVGAFAPGRRLWERALLAAEAAALPILAQTLSPYDPAWEPLLMANAPFLAEEGAAAWNAVCVCVAALLAAGRWAGRVRVPWGWARRALAPAPAALFAVAAFAAADPTHPLYDLLMCERAARRGDFRAILALPPERVVAHRMLCAQTIHALWREDLLEERLFDYPWRVSHTASSIETMAFDGFDLLYDYGIVLFARRWCHESVVNRGWSPHKLALMARISLATGEWAAARRFAGQLARAPFRRREAEALAAQVGDVARFDARTRRVAELHARLSLDPGSPVFEGDKRLEPAIYDRYAVLKNGDRRMVALYLCASLLRRDTVPFLENYDVILRVWPRRPLPRAFQQALLAAASTVPPAEQPRLTADLFSPGMAEAFAVFRRRVSPAAAGDPDFLGRFGRTYWFYAAFVP